MTPILRKAVAIFRRAPIRPSLLALGCAVLSSVAAPAWADTLRIAVVVGSNRGDTTHSPLRFAEQDASRMSAVLVELGGLAASDVLLLRSPKVAEVRAALDEGARRVKRWRGERRGQAVLVFYFSGHSDGQVLELSGEALPFAELRQRMADSQADVRLSIVDSCRSGALLALKGGTLGEAFDIRLADDLATTGEALIASSAADEAALESSEIGASFFTHHLVSGLRGAADLSGDGLVTLAEAYQYASARTLRATSDTVIGPQHAAYDYHLAGRGDLVLTFLRRPSAVLDLPRDFDRLLLVSLPREQVVAELGPRSAHRIALPAGEYRLRGWRGTRPFSGRIKLAEGESQRVDSAIFSPSPQNEGIRKGGDVSAVAVARALPPLPSDDGSGTRSVAVAVAAGVGGGAAEGAWLGLVRIGVDRAVNRAIDGSWGSRARLGLGLLAGTGRVADLRENRFGAAVTPSLWWGGDRLRWGAGLGLGAGVVLQRMDGGDRFWSGLAWASPALLLELRIGRAMALGACGEAQITLLRRDDRLTATVLPTAWFGLSRSF